MIKFRMMEVQIFKHKKQSPKKRVTLFFISRQINTIFDILEIGEEVEINYEVQKNKFFNTSFYVFYVL